MELADNLFSSIKGYITPDFIKHAGTLTGESPSKTSAGIEAAIPQILSGVADKGSTAQGSNELIQTIRDDGYDMGVPTNYLDHLKGGKSTDHYMRKGSELLGSVFGNRLGSVTSAFGSASGLGGGSSTKLLGLVAPLVMGVLGSRVKKQGYSASALTGYLSEQRSQWGRPSRPEVVEREEPARAAREQKYVAPEAREKHGMRAWPIALAALLALGAFWLFRGMHRPEVSTPPAVHEQAGQMAAPPAVTPTAPPMAEQQQAGQVATQPAAPEVNAPAKSPIDTFIESGSDADLPKTFSSSNLHFESGTATLAASSAPALDALAASLKSHPSVVIRVEGNTDAQGSAASNAKLSLARADAIKQALVERGADASHIKTAGIGQKNPVASNSSEEGRMENRRTDIVIVQR